MELCTFLLKDPATWRDLLWLQVDMTAGYVTSLLAFVLVPYGIEGFVLAAGVWKPIVEAGGTYWYAFLPIDSLGTALLAVPLGVGFMALGATVSPSCCAATSCWRAPSWTRPRRCRSNGGCSGSPRPGMTPWTPPPPNCAASSAICTTAPRPGWSPWA